MIRWYRTGEIPSGPGSKWPGGGYPGLFLVFFGPSRDDCESGHDGRHGGVSAARNSREGPRKARVRGGQGRVDDMSGEGGRGGVNWECWRGVGRGEESTGT